jgi:surfeit locus 1 family protein
MRRWHRPSLFAWLLLCAGVAAFLGLARWQWQRGEEKQRLLASFEAAAKAGLRQYATLPAALDPQEYPRVAVRGSYRRERGYWLDQQVRNGQVGRHAIAVFAPAGDSGAGQNSLLLVDQGWIAAPPGQPAPAWPALPDGETELHGIYAPPPGGGLRIGGNALARQQAWPKLTLFIDPAAVAADLGGVLAPRLLLLDADPAAGFAREWTPATIRPEKHRGYALQWFSFAVAALVIFVVLHWRKSNKGNP